MSAWNLYHALSEGGKKMIVAFCYLLSTDNAEELVFCVMTIRKNENKNWGFVFRL